MALTKLPAAETETQFRALYYLTAEALHLALKSPLENEAEVAELLWISDELRELIAAPGDTGKRRALIDYANGRRG